jgi:hypothetical protein
MKDKNEVCMPSNNETFEEENDDAAKQPIRHNNRPSQIKEQNDIQL